MLSGLEGLGVCGPLFCVMAGDLEPGVKRVKIIQ